jgi:uncharacterized protein involved in outer membrane biogenesis
MKKLLGIIIIVFVAIVAFFVFSNPLGRLVKLAIEGIGPDMLQAEVRVGDVTISATDGHGTLTGLKLGNPKGYNTDHALMADKIEIVLDPTSLAGNIIVLPKVLIEGPNIIYESGTGGSNFDAIQRNVDAYLGAAGKGDSSGKAKPKKLIIESFVIRDAKISYNGKVNLSLPDIEMHNIGKNSGGASPGAAIKSIVSEINAKLASAITHSAALGALGDKVKDAGNSLKGLLGK